MADPHRIGERSLDAVFRALRARPMLSPEALADLARDSSAGSLAARRELVAAHLPLVIAMAKKLAGAAELADLINEGVLGLLDAAERFDPGRGVKFATYAHPWIRKRLYAAVRASGCARATEHARRLLDVEDLEHARLAQVLGREPTESEVDAALGRSAHQAATAAAARLLRLGGEAALARLAADELDPEAELDRRRELERLRAALADVAPDGTRARALIDASLAEDDLDTIAAGLGLSRRQADQLLAGTLDRIRRGLHGPAPDQLRLFPDGPA